MIEEEEDCRLLTVLFTLYRHSGTALEVSVGANRDTRTRPPFHGCTNSCKLFHDDPEIPICLKPREMTIVFEAITMSQLQITSLVIGGDICKIPLPWFNSYNSLFTPLAPVLVGLKKLQFNLLTQYDF